MLGFTSRTRAASALVVLVGSAGLAALPATTANAAPTGNACFNSVTSAIAPVQADFSATVPATVAPNGKVDVKNLKATITMPGAVFVTGYNLGVVTNGSMVGGKVKATIAGTGSTEGQKDTNLIDAQLGPVKITDPDGVKGSGDETAEPVSGTVNFADLQFTAGASGKVDVREASVAITNANGGGGLQIDAALGFLTVKFRCSPGTVDVAANTAAWNTAAPFATTTVESPAAAPVATNDTLSVPANQAGSVNVIGNDTDANGDIDAASVTIVDAPAAGTAVANPDGTVTYTNTAAATSDSFTYTVKDKGGRVSNKATVAVTVLGDTTGPGGGLDQVVEIDVKGATMTLKQSGATVKLGGITLDGNAQKSSGKLNGLTVINASGTGTPWSLTGQVTKDFSNGKGTGVCPANDPKTWNNNCIPGGNLGWTPSASVAHDVVAGDVAKVSAGAAAAKGLDEAQELCSAEAGQSGGTFNCGGDVELAVPASAAAGTYKGTLTLTLV